MPQPKLASVSLEELKREILHRQKALPRLIAQRDELDRQIAELQGLGSAKAVAARKGPSRKRATMAMSRRGKTSLVGMLTEILKSKAKVSISEAMQALTRSGYKSKSKNFRTIVSVALAKDERFKRVGRGLYALNG